jgi:hypothetical protein
VFGDVAEQPANPAARLGREKEQELRKHRNICGVWFLPLGLYLLIRVTWISSDSDFVRLGRSSSIMAPSMVRMDRKILAIILIEES